MDAIRKLRELLKKIEYKTSDVDVAAMLEKKDEDLLKEFGDKIDENLDRSSTTTAVGLLMKLQLNPFKYLRTFTDIIDSYKTERRNRMREAKRKNKRNDNKRTV